MKNAGTKTSGEKDRVSRGGKGMGKRFINIKRSMGQAQQARRAVKSAAEAAKEIHPGEKGREDAATKEGWERGCVGRKHRRPAKRGEMFEQGRSHSALDGREEGT